MKTYITRINGWSLRDKSHYMQHMVAEIAHQLGCREMGLYRYYAEEENDVSLGSRLDGIIAGINGGDLVICQFPTGNGMRFENALVDRLKAYGGRIAFFIHELESLADEVKQSQMGKVVHLLNKAEELIVPTYAMQQWLLENGIHKGMKFVVQEMWDYTVSETFSNPLTLKKEIYFTDGEGFAGMNNWNYSVPLKLYNVSASQGNVQNLGEREPYQLLWELNRGGGFGLIWYRDEYFRQYMEKSNSFSLARYLAAGLPVIVPVGCSHQTLIEENSLGLVVNSLEEAVAAVGQMTEEEHQQYVKAVEHFAPILRNGYFTKKCLIEAMQGFYRKDAGRLPIPEKAYEVGECVFRSAVLNESYGDNWALSWDYQGATDGFLIYDTTGVLIGDIHNPYQHYFLQKEQGKEKGILIKAYVKTLKGKMIIAESELIYWQERNYGSPKVSIVIPAYNAEEYIARCIDNVLAQTQPNVEIIVVNDGSTDNTPEMVDWYAAKYENVVAIHQENGGISVARNAGIRQANGEYIGFVDADDMLYPSMVERLYQSAKKNDCDIAITSLYRITKQGYEILERYPLREDIAISTDEFLKMLNTRGWLYAAMVMNKLYKAELIKNRLFPPVRLSEDSAWSPYILSYADKICYIDDCSYEYDRTICANTLIDEWHNKSEEESFRLNRKLILFYLKNGNPERIAYLKERARQELTVERQTCGAYEELWQEINNIF